METESKKQSRFQKFKKRCECEHFLLTKVIFPLCAPIMGVLEYDFSGSFWYAIGTTFGLLWCCIIHGVYRFVHRNLFLYGFRLHKKYTLISRALHLQSDNNNLNMDTEEKLR